MAVDFSVEKQDFRKSMTALSACSQVLTQSFLKGISNAFQWFHHGFIAKQMLRKGQVKAEDYHGKFIKKGLWRNAYNGLSSKEGAFTFYVDKILRFFDPSLSIDSLFTEAYVLT